MCEKIKYTSRKKGKAAIKTYNKINRKGAKLTDTYFCEECQHWVLTSQAKQSSRDYRRHLNNKKNGRN